MGLKQRIIQNKKPAQERYKEYLQSFLAWMYLQNRHFYENLTDEEIGNYFFNGIEHPHEIQRFISFNSFNILVKTHQYISRYKDKTTLFAIKNKIQPINKGNYKKGDV